ncbi:hypothetical protein [Parafilimonas sp.]|uniref:hypothetical protein n=1 Tax=Parafilimonas sp. TaxID=1969739 RepID=UPI0039E50A1E
MKIFLVLFASVIFSTSSAQSVSASVDRDKILLGEQVTLKMMLNNVDESRFFVAAWPQVNDTIRHTEIIKRAAIDTINLNGSYTYQQNFVITSFDSGRWQLGPFDFIIQAKASGKSIRLQTAPLYITVLPVDVSSLNEYHPIKDVIDVQTRFNWLPVLLTALAILLIIVIVIIIIIKRKKRPVLQTKPELKGTPLERALEKFHALQQESLSSAIAIKKFHSGIDEITRQYLEEATHIKALHLTASELLPRLKFYMQDASVRNNFSHIFDLNASVKFARYFPGEEESRNMLKEITQIIINMDDNINRARTDADRLVPKY